MKNLENELDQIWDNNLEPLWQEYALLTIKTFRKYAKRPEFKILHNYLREKKERAASVGDKLFDNIFTQGDYIELDNMIFKFNINPSLRYHLFAMPNERKKDPQPKDNLAIINFVNNTDYVVFLNLQGSGASTPEQLHYQGQKRKNFPLLMHDFKKTLLVRGEAFNFYAFEEVNHGYLFEYEKDSSGKIAGLLRKATDSIAEHGLSYNLLFDAGKVFIFPRTKEIAERIPKQLVDAGMNKWKIAGQEMGYLFTAKYKTIFDAITPKVLYDALEDVTLKESDKKSFDSLLREVFLKKW